MKEQGAIVAAERAQENDFLEAPLLEAKQSRLSARNEQRQRFHSHYIAKNHIAMSSEEDKEQPKAGIASRIGEFMDQQRLERLKQCQEIDAVLRDCLQRRNKMLNGETVPQEQESLSVDQIVPGTRMMRYFGWHKETPSSPESVSFSSVWQSASETDETTVTVKEEMKPATTANASASSTVTLIPTCAKEMHAIWACRSVCLGCAGDLRNLKDCFQLLPEEVLNAHETAYEPTLSNVTIPCRQSQEELGRCVVKNAKELQQRLHPDNRGKVDKKNEHCRSV